MKIKIVHLLILALTIQGFAQPKKEINLPKGGKDIKINRVTGLYSLYVTKNQEVYNDDKRLEYYQDINYTYLNQFYKNISYGDPLVLIYADNKTPYRFVSKIKEYIPGHRWIFYMTENIEGLKATAFGNYAPDKNLALEEIITLDDEIKIKKFNDSVSSPPLPPPNMWYDDFVQTIYSGNKEAIQEALKNYAHSVINISQIKKLDDNKLVLDKEFVKNAIKNNNIVFLRFDDSTLYEDYIFVIQKIKEVLIELEKLDENIAYVIEISNQLNNLFENLSIQLGQK
ncbi:MAG: hypothetical protein U1C58_05810 [Flavobacteriaceae bacterium]|nr:hypothetical protein [Flavobacteriaceae bacterium]